MNAKTELENAYYKVFEANSMYIKMRKPCNHEIEGHKIIESIINDIYMIRYGLEPTDEMYEVFINSIFVSFDNVLCEIYNEIVRNAEIYRKKDKWIEWIGGSIAEQEELYRNLMEARIHLTVFNTIREWNKKNKETMKENN